MSDEFVASVLKNDARDSSIRYSALGLQALLPKRYALRTSHHDLLLTLCNPRPTINAPRPNTRFLKNIIKETDSHNAALRAKEAEESRARLRELRGQSLQNALGKECRYSGADGHRSEPTGRERKRRRVEDVGEYENWHDGNKKSDRSGNRWQNGDEESRRYRRSRRIENADHETDDSVRSSRRSSRHRHRTNRHRHRSRSRDSTSRSRKALQERRTSRSGSRDYNRERSHHHSRRKRRSSSSSSHHPHSLSKSRHSKLHQVAPSKDTETLRQRSTSPKSDSDPLEAIIGPPPPPPEPKVRSRGRGTFASASVMDTHFSTAYDPSVDVHPNSDSENDWDQALEALRDRQRWKQQGAERLRSAGFTEDEVQKWEKGGERREEDVRWAKKGEGREWDRGKVVDDEGGIGVKPEWGRLKVIRESLPSYEELESLT